MVMSVQYSWTNDSLHYAASKLVFPCLYQPTSQAHARIPVKLTPNVSQNDRRLNSTPLDHWDYQTNHGFLRFTLTGPDLHNFQAFGHTVYASEVIQSNQSNPGSVPPNQPYVPMLERLTLDYTTTKITFFDPAEYFEGDQTDFFYHIEPFGEKDVLIDRTQKSIGIRVSCCTLTTTTRPLT